MARALGYCDDLRRRFVGIEVLLVGAGVEPGMDPLEQGQDVRVRSYDALVSRARSELAWLAGQLSAERPTPRL